MTHDIRQISGGFHRVRGGDEIPPDVGEDPTFDPQAERLEEDLPTNVPDLLTRTASSEALLE